MVSFWPCIHSHHFSASPFWDAGGKISSALHLPNHMLYLHSNMSLAMCSDAYNFQVPYMVSISLSVLDGFLYAIAPAFSNNKTALASVALGRIMGGFGRANSALGFAYVARACPSNQRTSMTAILGGVQMVGMAIAPLFSVFLAPVDFTFCGVHFDKLNSVGER